MKNKTLTMNMDGLRTRFGFVRGKYPVNSASKENNSSPKITRKNNEHKNSQGKRNEIKVGSISPEAKGKSKFGSDSSVSTDNNDDTVGGETSSKYSRQPISCHKSSAQNKPYVQAIKVSNTLVHTMEKHLSPRSSAKMSPKNRRVIAVNNEVPPKSPPKPRTNPNVWKSSSSGPSPYKSLQTRQSAPIVTLTGFRSRHTYQAATSLTIKNPNKSIEIPNLQIPPCEKPKIPVKPPLTSQLPGLRASFFSPGYPNLNSANIHSRTVNIGHKEGAALSTKEMLATETYNVNMKASTEVAKFRSQKKSPNVVPFIKNVNNEENENIKSGDISKPQQRKWRKKIEPKYNADSDNSVQPLTSVEYLNKLRSSNLSVLSKARQRTQRPVTGNCSTLPVIPQEFIGCPEGLGGMDDSMTRIVLSPSETEDDSGIFTSSLSKYSLNSLPEEKAVQRVTSINTTTASETSGAQSTGKLSKSLIQKFQTSGIEESKSIDVIDTRHKKVTKQTSRSEIVHSDSDEQCSSKTSTVKMMDDPLPTSEAKIPKVGNIVQERLKQFQKSDDALITEKSCRQQTHNLKTKGKEPTKLRSFAKLKTYGRQAPSTLDEISQIKNFSSLQTITKNKDREEPSLICPKDTRNQGVQKELYINQVMSTSSSSNFSNKSGAKTNTSPSCSDNENKDFLIDDDYNDQQELTFYGHDDSLDESIFEQVDSLLMRRQETQENNKTKDQDPQLLDETDGPIHPSDLPTHMPRLCKIPEKSHEKASSRQGSLDTLSDQESIVSDDSMLDLEERFSLSQQPPLVPAVQENGVQPERSDVVQEVMDVQIMLVKLKTILLEADTANPKFPPNLFAKIAREDVPLKYNDKGKFDTEESSKLEENQDLKRQLVFLRQQLEEKDRKIKCLENQVASGLKQVSSSTKISVTQKNTASQTDQNHLAPGGVERPHSIHGDSFISPDDIYKYNTL